MSSGLLSLLAAEIVSQQFAWIATPEGAILEVSPALEKKLGGKLPVDQAVFKRLTQDTIRDGAAVAVTTIDHEIWRLRQVSVKYEQRVLIAGWGDVVA